MKKGTLRVFACGGAGINVIANIENAYRDLGDGFSDIEIVYIDSSIANAKRYNIDKDENFFIIESTELGSKVDGSGGERRENAKHIVDTVRKIINRFDYKDENSIYNVVVFGTAGGTGSVIGPVLTKGLLEKGATVISFMIGDSGSGIHTINTLNTLASMNAVSKQTQKALAVNYVDNAKMSGATAEERKVSADVSIFNTIAAISLFCSGEVCDIDQKDMKMFFNQSRYQTIAIKPGLYMVFPYKKKVELPSYLVPTGCRVAHTADESGDTDVEFFHFKSGVIDNENVKNVYRENTPIFLATFANAFTVIENELKEKTSNIRSALESATTDDVTAENGAVDNGLVL